MHEVDKRGRPVTSSHQQDQLKRFYRMRSPEPSTSEQGFVDYARGGGELYSSGSEEEDDTESDVDEDELELGQAKRKMPHQLLDDMSDSDEDEDEDGDEQEGVEDDSDGSHLDIDLSETEELPGEDEDDDVADDGPTIDPTLRIAAVNLDWDNLRASDLFTVFNSFLQAGSKVGTSAQGAIGRLVDVKIYPSEFGKARMEKEDEAGPGGGAFLSRDKGKGKAKPARSGLVRAKDIEEEEESSENDLEEDTDGDESYGEDESGEDEDETGDDNADGAGLEIVSDVSSERGEDEIDMDQLRQYQLERLRFVNNFAWEAS